MWGDSESAFKNTSIEHNFNFRGPFQKNLEIRMYSDLARSVKRDDRVSCIQLYQSLKILLKEDNILKKATGLYLRKKHYSVSIFCLGASK